MRPERVDISVSRACNMLCNFRRQKMSLLLYIYYPPYFMYYGRSRFSLYNLIRQNTSHMEWE